MLAADSGGSLRHNKGKETPEAAELAGQMAISNIRWLGTSVLQRKGKNPKGLVIKAREVDPLSGDGTWMQPIGEKL